MYTLYHRGYLEMMVHLDNQGKEERPDQKGILEPLVTEVAGENR